MSSRPEISVVMPVYNCRRFVSAAIESILCQTIADFEFIIVDDGSTDGSSDILDKYARRDTRIRVISRPNTGIVGALNDGIAVASAALLARMDADDISHTTRFELQLRYLESHPECLVVGTAISVVDPRGSPLFIMRHETDPAILRKQLLETIGGGIAHPTVMMRRDDVVAVDGYRREFEFSEDRDLWLRMDERGMLANLPDVLYTYRWHLSSTCHTQQQRQRDLKSRMITEACNRRGIPVPDLACQYLEQSSVSTTVAEHYTRWCFLALEAGNYSTGCRYAFRALLRRPFCRPLWWMACEATVGPEKTDALKQMYRSVMGRTRRFVSTSVSAEKTADDLRDASNDDRLNAARLVTQFLEERAAASFLRLGDGEIQCIRAVRNGQMPPRYKLSDGEAASVEAPFSVSGIEARYVPRLLHAYEHCSFLDYCDNIPAVQQSLPMLGLNRAPGLMRNKSPDTSNIIFEWTAFELKGYLSRHRCLLASAESRLLSELCKDDHFRSIADEYLPFDSLPVFHQIRENGRRFSENLELIKDDLRQDIERHQIDTLFLSLASGAKILCYELAEELGIRCVDFGSMPRALTYSGSPGYHTHRNFHNPFLFRVPIAVYMSALERAHPELTMSELLAKAQAQVLLELYDLRPFRFNNSEAVAGADILRTQEALARFRHAQQWYFNFYASRCQHESTCQGLHADFIRWRRKKGIGVDGKIFLALVTCKALARQVVRFASGQWS